MAEPTIQLGGGNWAGKTDNLLGYYKEGERFYKQDFTFSRSTTGTYTDSEGYIQEMPYNLLEQSNDFDTTWTLSASIDLTSGQSGYDGSNDAWLLKRNSTGSRYVQQTLTRPSGQYSFSVYLKAESTDWVYIWAYDGSTAVNAYFDLNNGVVGNTSGLDSTNVVSVGNGWYRCSITFTQAITSVRIYPAYANGSIATGTDNGIYIQNAQLVKGTSAKTYFPTTTRLNMPRVDYLNNSNGSLILEPQRTNLFAYSEDFSQSFWNKASSSVTLTSQIAPNGTSNSVYNLVGTSANLYAGGVTGVQHTISFYIKSNGQEKDKFKLRLGNNTSVEYTATNEWVRYEYTETPTTSVFGITTTSAPNNEFDLLVWGGQSEQGSYATTLINTSGSSVTRNADACELSNVADRINSSEGVLYAEIAGLDNDGTYRTISLSNGTLINRLSVLYNPTSNNVSYYIRNTSGVLLSNNNSVTNVKDTIKIAIKYKSTDFAVWLNGVEVATSTLTGDFSSNNLTKLSFDNGSGSDDFYGKCNQIQVYNTALSDTELAELTTL